MYTEKETEKLLDIYDGTPESVELCMQVLERSKKSIVGKLAKLGVYQKQEYKTKTGEDPETKVQIVSDIENFFELEAGSFAGLEKSPKLVLKELRKCVFNEAGRAGAAR